MKLLINPNYDGYQRGLESMVYKFFNNITGLEAYVNEVLAQEMHNPVMKKVKRRKINVRFEDNIWAADLAEMGSLYSLNRGVKYLLCVINIFAKCIFGLNLLRIKS